MSEVKSNVRVVATGPEAPPPRRPAPEIDESEVVLIWSGEYGAWRRPEGRGYTTDRDAAGRWWLADARKLTRFSQKIKFHVASRRPEREVR